MLSTPTPLDIERANELRAELWARRAEMQRAHAELDRLAIPTRDQFREPYDLPARIERMQIEFAEMGAMAEQYRRNYLHLLDEHRAVERRRVKLEHALSIMRRVNYVLDAISAWRNLVRTCSQRIKRTGVCDVIIALIRARLAREPHA